ncbi:MAG: tetratricopeptide repeat protein, partial [Anaerolineaceae bacterium]|nr:tetratricopeptide repeat protein [Anaerolineaceae bacterium]
MSPSLLSQQIAFLQHLSEGIADPAQRTLLQPLLDAEFSQADWEQLNRPDAWHTITPAFPLAAHLLARLAQNAVAGAEPIAFLPLLPLLRFFAETSASSGFANAGNLWLLLGENLQVMADFSGAGSAFSQALSLDEERLGSDHPNIVQDLNQQALNLRERGAPREALPLLERALQLVEAAQPGAEPLAKIHILSSLGLTWQDLGDLEEARQQLEHALELTENVLGKAHPEVASCLDGLGIVLRDQGELEPARKFLERALAIDEASFGSVHPAVARDINDLGVILQSLGDNQAALRAHER